ncbi:MAG TPA: hypothetical protein VG651_05825 [Stellaceae bacterium]|nr:hypothetical protein [Stellaceae bacterium]
MTAGRVFAARLGLVAVLFQAILFGWHHHDLTFAGRLPAPAVENHSAAPQIADDEDGCEICQVLHHQIAVTPDFPPAPTPSAIAAGLDAGDAPFIPRSPALAFRARAPPSLDAAGG